ncbi:hypothetical protein [Ancylobacter sp. IITR112]|uniref:hypothetical protein n=1 Tax=Ancylobacter sp. IITR112 TaxID=3138073 RepID=UPI00352BB290
MTLYRWQATITDEAGNVMPGAQVTVRNEATGLLASLFADKEGAEPLDNPFTIDPDGDGGVAFYVAAGFYEITATLGTLIAAAQDANVGSMNAADYDPDGVEADVFNSANTRYDNATSGLDAENVQAALDELAEKVTFTGALLTVAAGSPLPTEDVGPLYHVDYADTMTWQVYDANGAAYEGYASDGIGDIVKLGRSTPRRGTLKANGADISTTTYAALYGWALHHGLVETSGVWAAGTFRFREASGGTFRLPDLRGEFDRAWDDGRGVDSGRALGSWQNHQLQDHDHSAARVSGGLGYGDGGAFSITNTNTGAPTSGNHGAETRPRNVALLYAIKF